MKSRIDRAVDEMKKAGLKQLLVSDPKSIRYLTGIYHEPFERMFFFLLRDNGEHVFFLNHLFFIGPTGFNEVRYSDMDDQMTLLVEQIDEKEVLGVDKVMTARFLVPLQERMPNLKTVLGSDCVDNCRAVKDEEEIAIMKRSSEINDLVMERAIKHAAVGMSEKELADYIDEQYAAEGVVPCFTTIVCYGENAADSHHVPSADVKLKEGQCVLIDMGCIYKNYCSDMTRTFYMHSVDDEQAKIYEIVREAQQAACDAVKPGVKMSEIYAVCRKVIDDSGYGKYWTIRLGHFIGQEDHEKGDVGPNDHTPAAPGMIFSIEPGIYIEGFTGVRIEDLVLVTEDGYENLNAVDKKLLVV